MTNEDPQQSASGLPDFLKKRPYIKAREQEVNIIFVEEMNSSSIFQSWFLKKMSLEDSNQFTHAWISLTEKGTECDIVVRFKDDKHVTLLLIENKIDAPERPNQAERYDKLGKYLVKDNVCDRYVTCLLFPERYDKKGTTRKKYHQNLSYEELLEWFKTQPVSERMRFKQMVIKNGIKKAKTGYEPQFDENTNRFNNYYRKIAQETYPELKLSEKNYSGSNTWIYIGHAMFPSNIEIVHKGRHGRVDLQISKIDKNKFYDWYQNKAEDKMSIQGDRKTKAIILRIKTPKIQNFENIEEPANYRNEIAEALQAAEQLKNWYFKWRNESIFEQEL